MFNADSSWSKNERWYHRETFSEFFTSGYGEREKISYAVDRVLVEACWDCETRMSRLFNFVFDSFIRWWLSLGVSRCTDVILVMQTRPLNDYRLGDSLRGELYSYNIRIVCPNFFVSEISFIYFWNVLRTLCREDVNSFVNLPFFVKTVC